MDTNGNSCPICFESLKDKTVGSPDICDHKFCLLCLEKWAKHGNFCPVDRKKFKNIISGDTVIQISYKRRKQSSALYDISVYCEICKEVKEENDTVILCDSCDLGFHSDCLDPPLKSIPRGNWHCPDCQEVARKLKSQKTKHEGKILPHKAANSKQHSSLPHHHHSSKSKQTDKNRVKSKTNRKSNLKIETTKHNHLKPCDFSKRDHCQKDVSCTETVNLPGNCSTPPGEFEDFLSISENDVVLTKRKPLNAEEQSFDEIIGNESTTSSDIDFRSIIRNNYEMLQNERKKRLAAAVARKKIFKNMMKFFKNSTVTSLQDEYSTARNNCQDKAFSNTLNHEADIKKCALSSPSLALLLNNMNLTSDVKEHSLSKPDYGVEVDLGVTKMKKAPIQNLNNPFTNIKSPNTAPDSLNKMDHLCGPEKAIHKAHPTKTKTNSSLTENLNNNQVHTISDSLSVSEETDIISADRNLPTEKKSPNKDTMLRRCRFNSNSPQTKVRAKRLAAENARKKLHISSDESSSDESLVENSVAKKRHLAKSSPDRSNHHLFTDIEKVLSHRSSPLLSEMDTETSSECELVISNSENLKSIKKKNTGMEDLNRKAASKSSSPCKNPKTLSISEVPYTDDLNRIESLSVFEKPACKSSAVSTEIKNSSLEDLNNAQIHLQSESFSVAKESAFEEPPGLELEILDSPKNSENEVIPELTLEPLAVIGNPRKENLFIKDVKRKQIPPIANESKLEKGSSSAFSVFEKISDASGYTKKETSKNNITTDVACYDVEDDQNVEDLEGERFSEEKRNSSDVEVVDSENIVDSFHIRQIHYAIKAKMNLPSELRKIEQETWMTRKSTSSKKYKYKSSRKDAGIRISSSSHNHHQIKSGNEELHNFLKNTCIASNNSSLSKKDLTECNYKFNPFYESVSAVQTKKLFKVAEFKLQPSDKQVCFDKIPKEVLRSFTCPYSLKHLDIREDGSLFLNWNKF